MVSDNQRRDIDDQLARIVQIISRLESSKQATLTMLEKKSAVYCRVHPLHRHPPARREGIRIMKENMENYRHYQTGGLINKDQLTNGGAVLPAAEQPAGAVRPERTECAADHRAGKPNPYRAANFDNQIYQMELQRYELQRSDKTSMQLAILLFARWPTAASIR